MIYWHNQENPQWRKHPQLNNLKTCDVIVRRWGGRNEGDKNSPRNKYPISNRITPKKLEEARGQSGLANFHAHDVNWEELFNKIAPDKRTNYTYGFWSGYTGHKISEPAGVVQVGYMDGVDCRKAIRDARKRS